MSSIELLQAILDQGSHQTRPGSDSEYFFHSRREHPVLPISRLDDTIFFPVSICFILQQYQDDFSPDENHLLQGIISRVRKACHDYRNPLKGNIYNFWRHGDNFHFPGGKFLHRYKHFKLPEDLDTTAMVHLAFPDMLDRKAQLHLKAQLAYHTNTIKGKVINALPAHMNLKAYSSWIGERMPVEFDICALCNFLLWVELNDLPGNEYDHDSLKIILDVVEGGLYFSKPQKLAPYYPDPAIQLYHLARLFSVKKGYDPIKEKLSKDIQKTLSGSSSTMERIILESSLLKLGVVQTKTSDINLEDVYHAKYSWFRAAFLAPYDNPMANILKGGPLFEMRYYCKAFDLTLLLEHFILTNQWKELQV